MKKFITSLFAVDISPNHFLYEDQGNGTGILKLNFTLAQKANRMPQETANNVD